MRCVLLAKKMAKIWLKLQENGEKKSQMAKVMAKEKYILARTLCNPPPTHTHTWAHTPMEKSYLFNSFKPDVPFMGHRQTI